MVDFLLASQNMPFTISLSVMLALALLEGVATVMGMGLSGLIDGLLPDLDLDLDIDMDGPDTPSAGLASKLLGWLRIGEVPAVILFIVFLTGFGLIGLGVQSFVQKGLGNLLPAIMAIVPAFILSLPVVRLIGGGIGKIMPKDETDAVSVKSFIGRIAIITQGKASKGNPAEAKLRDKHGHNHYILVEPDGSNEVFEKGTAVVLISQAGAVFKAILNKSISLVDEG
jgi:Inner membrane protein YqiJ, N-terminal/Inner membrane protein YqiJ, OB-fold